MFYLVKEEDELYDSNAHDNFNNTNEEIDIPSKNFLNWVEIEKKIFNSCLNLIIKML